MKDCKHEVKDMEPHCLFCIDELRENYEKLLALVKQEVANREYVCTTNHAVFCDNAERLLKEIGELND